MTKERNMRKERRRKKERQETREGKPDKQAETEQTTELGSHYYAFSFSLCRRSQWSQDWRIQWKTSAKRLKIKGAVQRPKGRQVSL
jgi:hypothetical protein